MAGFITIWFMDLLGFPKRSYGSRTVPTCQGKYWGKIKQLLLHLQINY